MLPIVLHINERDLILRRESSSGCAQVLEWSVCKRLRCSIAVKRPSQQTTDKNSNSTLLGNIQVNGLEFAHHSQQLTGDLKQTKQTTTMTLTTKALQTRVHKVMEGRRSRRCRKSSESDESSSRSRSSCGGEAKQSHDVVCRAPSIALALICRRCGRSLPARVCASALSMGRRVGPASGIESKLI